MPEISNGQPARKRTTAPEGLTVTAAVPTLEGEALLVFRSPEDSEAYRAHSGKHQNAEGWRVLEMDREMLAAVLNIHGLDAVVMPEERTGSGGSDPFTAARFFELLDVSRPE